MKLLMHTCCAPCSVYCIETLRNEGIEPVSYWFNPNIHPYMEYKARRDTLIEYTESIGIDLLIKEDYKNKRKRNRKTTLILIKIDFSNIPEEIQGLFYLYGKDIDSDGD